MPRTDEFTALSSAIDLADRALGDTPNHDFRDDVDRLRCRSYVFLCHAALEEYLESLSLSVLQQAYDGFLEGTVSQPVVEACSYYQIRLSDVQHRSHGPLSLKRVIFEASELALRTHRAAIKGNNGIKTDDQRKLFRPVGFDVHDFDHVLSQKLNSYGEARGSIAHLFHIREERPRAALQSDISLIKRLIEPFDEAVSQLSKVPIFA
ncbi:HEPN domain-containing protein [Roseivivax marinus]|uniref:HEPN domain-containing protein n=1 Tax=Roseivivax marinus TaxID=1379903 RepID=UPI00273F1A53|nr:HEPN domain-containing protein [Roseivivax marinus]